MAAKTTGTKKKTASKPKTAPKKDTAPPPEPNPPIRRELAGAIFLFLGVLVIISYFSDEGSFIKEFSAYMKGLLGWGYHMLAPCFFVTAYNLIFHHGRPVTMKVTAAMLIPVLFAAMLNMIIYVFPAQSNELTVIVGDLYEKGRSMDSGGVLGGLLGYGLESAFSAYAAFPLLFVGFVFFGFKALGMSISGTAGKIKERMTVPYDEESYTESAPAAQSVRRESVKREASVSAKPVSAPASGKRRSPIVDIPLGDDEEPLTLNELDDIRPADEKPAPRKAVARVRKKTVDVEIIPPEEPAPFSARSTADVAPMSFDDAMSYAGVDVGDGFREFPTVKKEKSAPAAVPVTAEISDPPKSKKVKAAEIASEAKSVEMAVSLAESSEDEYKFPPVELLRSGSGTDVDARDEIIVNKDRLEGAIKSFGINASIVGVIHGPTVTRYDIELEQGVKLSRVTNLAGDLALALGVINVRIAPIPDKISTVGIEVPNKIVSTVYLRTIIDSPKFRNAKSKLSFAIGKDIGGECIVGNISKLPHMLIAGTTGSGKSVCMNSLILSLLYKARPDEVRLIMIDPKMVELGVYNGIPHLYVPVVTDPKKAAGALQWSEVEMLKRYRLFSEVGVRDIDTYNAHCTSSGEPAMPRVVIVIDELADLMMTASKEVESSICRVAQMGRAAGMHLIIATQRPSADVITGLMKANIPSRIAFAVSSAMESRIILDQAGAEKLVGMGDMLFSPVGCGKPTRIQGAFVSDEEREEVIQFIKESCGRSEQNSEIMSFMDKALEDKKGDEKSKDKDADSIAGDYDEMLPQAVEAVLELKQCSVSSLQRRVKLGYSRAARIVDQMEELGIVGPYEGAKPRSVLIDRDGWHQIQVSLGMAPADSDISLAEEMNEE